MQIVLISIMIILVLLSIYQERKLSRLRKKTLAAFRIVCKRIDKKKAQNKEVINKKRKEDKNANSFNINNINFTFSSSLSGEENKKTTRKDNRCFQDNMQKNK